MSPNDDPRLAEIRHTLDRAAAASSLDIDRMRATLAADDRRLLLLRAFASEVCLPTRPRVVGEPRVPSCEYRGVS